MGNFVSADPREVENLLLADLERVPPDLRQIGKKLDGLEKRFGVGVYSDFLYLLSHIHFPPAEARRHWGRILSHRISLERRTGRAVDFRVALLDYLLSRSRRMRSPKVIEIRVFQKTQDSAIRDEMTGLYNYRHFREQLRREVDRTRRNGESLSLAFFDLDYFKWYNDHNGHIAGDRALQAVGRLISEEIRKSDLAFRYGGEEFAVLLPGANKAQACLVAERIRKRIAEHPFPYGDGQPGGRVTISGGVATFRTDARDAHGFLDMADQALYLAKGRGKNCISTASSECREYQRIEVRIQGTVHVLSGAPAPLVTRDVGEKGLRFLCAVPVRKGEYFGFRLRPGEAAEEIAGVGQAVRVKRAEGLFEVAARIVEVQGPDAKRWLDFLSRPEAGGGGDGEVFVAALEAPPPDAGRIARPPVAGARGRRIPAAGGTRSRAARRRASTGRRASRARSRRGSPARTARSARSAAGAR